ncbi:MAG: biotin--[acetyl-CoA-carboxylase] ligase, partial [Sinobacteraceae bacterium]|nr:biotin--[acetyl-CoA-carboxylase] ligase [Nevskiaceae bacterium]
MSVADPVILDALAERLLAADGPASAALLAEEFGWSQAQLTESLESLRYLGALIDTTSTGHTLQLDDPLDAVAIRTELPDASRLAVVVKRVCNSTNRAVQSLPVPALCVAEVQLGGCGRRGRQWTQPFGAGLMMSLSAKTPKGRLDALAIALSIAALECLEEMGLDGLQMKWPNDLMLDDAKLGGLMVEAEGGAQGRLCIGLGINVTVAPRLPDRPAAMLSELGET